ncbi:hypothetical protein ACT16_07960 [Mycobacterium heckeshornense]|nr:hypothetical protein ACT16_07960 [Mycobacterium heckeshornense]
MEDRPAAVAQYRVVPPVAAARVVAAVRSPASVAAGEALVAAADASTGSVALAGRDSAVR